MSDSIDLERKVERLHSTLVNLIVWLSLNLGEETVIRLIKQLNGEQGGDE